MGRPTIDTERIERVDYVLVGTWQRMTVCSVCVCVALSLYCSVFIAHVAIAILLRGQPTFTITGVISYGGGLHTESSWGVLYTSLNIETLCTVR